MLPGGVRVGGELRRDYAFRVLDGIAEMALAEAAGATDLPTQVTRALAAMLDHVGGIEPSVELLDGLSVADRQYLMTRLSAHLGTDQVWLTATCPQCEQKFDLAVRYSQLPVKPAGSDYPEIDVLTVHGRLRVRVPNGADQRAVLVVADPGRARAALARRCIVAWDGGNPADLQLDHAVLDAIDSAFESLAPEVATTAQAACPECQTASLIDLDPYHCLRRAGGDLFYEVHLLASHYHWSEPEILSLPRWRRARYLGLIDRARGMAH